MSRRAGDDHLAAAHQFLGLNPIQIRSRGLTTPTCCDHPGKQPPHDAGHGGLQRSGSRPADSWIPKPVQAGPSTRRSMATAASCRGPREPGRVRAQHDHPERRTDPARSFSGTHREECLTPQESTTIDTYPRESRLPSNRTKALQIRYFSARFRAHSWWIAPRRSGVRVPLAPLGEPQQPPGFLRFGRRCDRRSSRDLWPGRRHDLRSEHRVPP
jgi:hypothetical protein